MTPARNIFSGLYRSSGGRLRQTREMRPTELFLPACLLDSGLKKSTHRENMYITAFFTANTKVLPIWPIKVSKHCSIKYIVHTVDGRVTCCRGIPCRVHFVFEAWSGKEASNPVFEIKVDKGLDWQCNDFSLDRKSTRLNSSHRSLSRMPSSA